MIEGLRIKFKKKEKTVENLKKVLSVLGDDTWDDDAVSFASHNNMSFIYYDDIYSEYTYNIETKKNETELSLKKFFKKYDKSKYKSTKIRKEIDEFVSRQDAINNAFLAEKAKKDAFRDRVYEITNGLAELLIEKNKKYGDSALNPKRIFSKASATEQILVRLDDKISRLSNQNIGDDEDVIEDLLGYLVLLKISTKNES